MIQFAESFCHRRARNCRDVRDIDLWSCVEHGPDIRARRVLSSPYAFLETA